MSTLVQALTDSVPTGAAPGPPPTPQPVKSRMDLFQFVLPAVLTVLLVTASCQPLEDSEPDETSEILDHVSSSKSLQTTWENDQFQDAEEAGSCGENSVDCDSTSSEISFALQQEQNSKTESSEMESKTETLIDGTEGYSTSNQDDLETSIQSSKVLLQAFGPLGADIDETADSQSGMKEEEIWTEQTEDGTEQKRSGGRRFFSLMNLIKFLLNPVIEEFQEMEKSSTGQDIATSMNVNNQSGVANVPTGNSSDVGENERKNGTDTSKKTKFQCVGKNVTTNMTEAMVRIVNSTVLLEILSFDKNHSSADCVLVMFYAPWCHFCAATAPHYNAVARAFPQLEVLAVDTVHFSNLNARFGTVAVPNIMLFHQSRSAVRFNHTERHFSTLVQFITNTTGLEANTSVELSPQDYEGPLSSTPTEETDYLVWFAWFFIVICSGHIFISSQIGQRAIERVVVLWQEHQHIE